MNLASFARSPIGRHAMIYAFGASALQLLKHGRSVIEGGFELLDHIAGGKTEIPPEPAPLYATETAEPEPAEVIPPPPPPPPGD